MEKKPAFNYKILSLIGIGGMSKVYLAQDIKNNTNVAIKILDEKLFSDPDYIKRLSREIEISKELSHPNIVKVLSWGKYKNNNYIVYEYIKGVTLNKYIKNKKLSSREIDKIMFGILSGLSYAHSKNVIHRDIKPSNIMVSEEGIKILDFGIAKQVTKSTITRAGLFMGSPHYVSPEQIEGQKIDARSDIYSFGVMMYEVVTGKVPFDLENNWATIRAHLDKPVPRISKKVPDYLSYIIYKCMEKKPSDRFDSVSEIVKVISTKAFTTDIKSLKKIEQKSIAINRRKLFLVLGILVFVIAIWLIPGLSFYYTGKKYYNEGNYISAALNFNRAQFMLIPNAEDHKNLSLEHEFNTLENLLSEKKYSEVEVVIKEVRSNFPEYIELKEIEEKINEYSNYISIIDDIEGLYENGNYLETYNQANDLWNDFEFSSTISQDDLNRLINIKNNAYDACKTIPANDVSFIAYDDPDESDKLIKNIFGEELYIVNFFLTSYAQENSDRLCTFFVFLNNDYNDPVLVLEPDETSIYVDNPNEPAINIDRRKYPNAIVEVAISGESYTINRLNRNFIIKVNSVSIIEYWFESLMVTVSLQ